MDKPIIIEVEGYDGEDGSIVVENHRAERSMGRPSIIYCIGSLNADGIVRFSDWGYATIDEARRAIGYRNAAELKREGGT